MANLLAKLRINYSSLLLLEGVVDPPKEGTIRMHSKILDGFLEGQNDQCFVGDVEREKLHEKTNLHLRLRELLREHSKTATMIVMSLPMPRQVRIFITRSIHTFILLLLLAVERSVGSALHVLVGNANARYAAVLAGSRQPNLSLNLRFVKAPSRCCLNYAMMKSINKHKFMKINRALTHFN